VADLWEGGEGGGRRPCREEQENKFKNRQKLAQICAKTMQKPSKSVQFFSYKMLKF
jgi:hypothetical protein